MKPLALAERKARNKDGTEIRGANYRRATVLQAGMRKICTHHDTAAVCKLTNSFVNLLFSLKINSLGESKMG